MDKTRQTERGETTRRTFLGVTGATLSASGTVGQASAKTPEGEAIAGEKNGNGNVRLAVAGGGFGSHHYWHEHPHCEVTAVTDLVDARRRALASQYHCDNVFPSLEKMLNTASSSFDAVAIFTDAPSHAKHAVACMEHGKHVVSACPAAFTLDDCARIKEVKEQNDLIYMMHESSYYRQPCMAARALYESGEFGRLCYSELEYYHPRIGTRQNCLTRWKGLESWRYGLPPMLYPTHSLGLLVGVTAERIVAVSCLGQTVGSDFPSPKENAYGNPFTNEMALGITNKGNICRFGVCWMIAAHGERAQWLGEKASCYMVGSGGQPQNMMKMNGRVQPWNVPDFWKTDLLPEPMRHNSGHGGSATFLSAEFIDSILQQREPTVNIYEAIAMTAPGIVAHQSALKGGQQLDVPNFDPKPAGSQVP